MVGTDYRQISKNMNSLKKISLYSVTYIDNKRTRVTSETSYLTPDVLARPNLKVAIHATVTRVVFEKSGETTRAVAVDFTKGKNEPVYRARARREIIVWCVLVYHMDASPEQNLVHFSGGTIHSPQVGREAIFLSGAQR